MAQDFISGILFAINELLANDILMGIIFTFAFMFFMYFVILIIPPSNKP